MSDLVGNYAQFLMDYMPYLIPLPILLPALAAALAGLLSPHLHLQRIVALSTLLVLLVLAVSMVIVTDIERIRMME